MVVKTKVVSSLTESQEQIKLCQWLDQKGVLYYHVPNGGNRDIWTATRLKAEGVKSGVPDICVAMARKGRHGLYIELKREKGGALSVSQAMWIKRLREEGYAAGVCKGWKAAKKIVCEYLDIDD